MGCKLLTVGPPTPSLETVSQWSCPNYGGTGSRGCSRLIQGHSSFRVDRHPSHQMGPWDWYSEAGHSEAALCLWSLWQVPSHLQLRSPEWYSFFLGLWVVFFNSFSYLLGNPTHSRGGLQVAEVDACFLKSKEPQMHVSVTHLSDKNSVLPRSSRKDQVTARNILYRMSLCYSELRARTLHITFYCVNIRDGVDDYLNYLCADRSPISYESLKGRIGDCAGLICQRLHWDGAVDSQHVFIEWKV